MKTELRVADHNVLRGHEVIEIWHDNKFIGQVCGADVPGVRILSKYHLDIVTVHDPDVSRMANVIEIHVG